jgi:hypothetical protein
MKRKLNENPNYAEKMKTPVILGSITNWNLQEMLSAHSFVFLLLYYFMKAEFEKWGKTMESIYTDKEDFVGMFDQIFETFIDKLLANQGLLDKL